MSETLEVHRSEIKITQAWISVEQVAKYLGLSKRTIEDKIYEGWATKADGLTRIGSSIRFHFPTVEARSFAGTLFNGEGEKLGGPRETNHDQPR